MVDGCLMVDCSWLFDDDDDDDDDGDDDGDDDDDDDDGVDEMFGGCEKILEDFRNQKDVDKLRP